MNHLYSQIGDRVKKQRRRQGLSQDDLAERASLSRASISNIETGRQQLYVHHLVSIANALHMEPGEFLASSGKSDERVVDEQELLTQTFRSGKVERPRKRRGQ